MGGSYEIDMQFQNAFALWLYKCARRNETIQRLIWARHTISVPIPLANDESDLGTGLDAAIYLVVQYEQLQNWIYQNGRFFLPCG